MNARERRTTNCTEETVLSQIETRFPLPGADMPSNHPVLPMENPAELPGFGLARGHDGRGKPWNRARTPRLTALYTLPHGLPRHAESPHGIHYGHVVGRCIVHKQIP
jgi:hypothetical protein